jgi:hypothetical protein
VFDLSEVISMSSYDDVDMDITSKGKKRKAQSDLDAVEDRRQKRGTNACGEFDTTGAWGEFDTADAWGEFDIADAWGEFDTANACSEQHVTDAELEKFLSSPLVGAPQGGRSRSFRGRGPPMKYVATTK